MPIAVSALCLLLYGVDTIELGKNNVDLDIDFTVNYTGPAEDALVAGESSGAAGAGTNTNGSGGVSGDSGVETNGGGSTTTDGNAGGSTSGSGTTSGDSGTGNGGNASGDQNTTETTI